jgi:hypothetical protein
MKGELCRIDCVWGGGGGVESSNYCMNRFTMNCVMCLSCTAVIAVWLEKSCSPSLFSSPYVFAPDCLEQLFASTYPADMSKLQWSELQVGAYLLPPQQFAQLSQLLLWESDYHGH